MIRLDMQVVSLTDKLGTGGTFVDTKGTDDAVRGTDGNDLIKSGAGNDRIYSGAGDDKIYAGDGNDYVDAGSGNDIVYAGTGNDTVLGGTGADKIFGEDGNDWLDGGADNDFIDGGTGNDWLFGGTGADELFGGDGNDQLWGGDGNDYVSGDAGNDALRGDAGNDTLDGGSGNDWLDGGTGNDLVIGGSGSDWLLGGAGNDTLFGGNGWDQDGVRNTFEFGFSEARSLGTGVAANGQDLIADFQVGRDLIDIRSLVARFYDDQKGFYSFVDKGVGGSWSSGGVSVAIDSVNSYGEASARITFGASGTSATSSVTFQGVDVDELSSSMLLKPSWKLIYGSDAGEALTTPVTNYLGASGADVQIVVYAGGGDDTVIGGSGGDRIYGEAGNDLISGMAGNDSLSGGAGDDSLDGGSGGDYLYGGVGNDQIVGGLDGDRLWGEDGNDVMYGDSTDPASLTGGDDAMWGGNGGDRIFGGAGNDVLYGEAGNDSIDGGRGNDFIDGGSGNDTLAGGAGADTFAFRGAFKVDWAKGAAWLDLGTSGTGNGHDVITDFQKGVDKIRFVIAGQPDDLTSFTKSLGTTWLPDLPEQNQSFKSGVWGQLLSQVDTDGNGKVDALLIQEHDSPSALGGGMVTGDQSWSILVNGVFTNTMASESLSLKDVFEIA